MDYKKDINKHLDLFRKIADNLIKEEEEHPALTPIPASKMYEVLDLHVQDNPISDEAFEEALQSLVLNTPRTATHLFFNQLFGGRTPKAVLGDLLAVVLNNSTYTYKVGGPMIGIEKSMIRKMCSLIGYDENSEGTLATGGSMTNFMGLLMARDHYDSKARFQGVTQTMTLYTSEASHYSIPKNAAFAGIGRDNIRFIPTDDHGRMDSKLLEEAIVKDKAEGHLPFFVNATAGTTVMGAFDPLNEIADICEAHNLWLHVDGAYFGTVMFSDRYKKMIEGSERADSFSVNAHKLFNTPITCSFIFTKHKEALYDSFSNEASYLYQTDSDEWNPGKISLQCGRRNDALKFWTLWKSVGTKGLGAIIDHLFHLADVARKYVAKHPDYTLYSYENSLAVCFNYKGISPQILCNSLYEDGALVVGYGSFKENTFIRLVTVNSGNTEEDILQFFEKMEAYVEKNESALLQAAI